MKKPETVERALALIDARIQDLGDWRGKTLAKVRKLIHAADPEIVEEWKWMNSRLVPRRHRLHGGDLQEHRQDDVCQGAALKDPSRLFNSSLEGNVRRAIDIHEGEKIDEPALKDLIRAAVALNHQGKSHRTSKSKRASGKRAD